MAANSLTIPPPHVSQTIQCRLENGVYVVVVGDLVVVNLAVAVVSAVFAAAAMASLALAKCPSASVADCCVHGKDAACSIWWLLLIWWLQWFQQ
eukprot:5537587-Ditylum_brightwellii.AAC.1